MQEIKNEIKSMKEQRQVLGKRSAEEIAPADAASVEDAASEIEWMCAKLRSELGLVEQTLIDTACEALIDMACKQIGIDSTGSLVERARACLEALGVSSPIDHHSEGKFGDSF